jgi:hypothetical protein
MAHEDKRPTQPKPNKRGGRTAVAAGLLAIVAAVAAYLSNCIPGFGIGSSGTPGDAEQAEPAKPAEPEPEPAEPKPDEAKQGETPPGQLGARKPMPMKLTIDARGCSVGGDEPFDCEKLCDQTELFEGVDAVVIDAKHGPHGVVVEVLDCLKAKELAVSITRK